MAMIGDEFNSRRRRRSTRLQGYDYSSPGIYFVTVCTEGTVCLFGEIQGGEMELSAAGDTVVQSWIAIPRRFPEVQLDSFVVIPNHVHGIIIILERGDGRKSAASSAPAADHSNAPENARATLGKIMRAFKSISAIKANDVLGRKGQQIWQRNYFEHIVRLGKDLQEIRNYIAENPRQWGSDSENPGQTQ
jgi:REP element-mobilizing transposase RayT